MNIYRSYGLKQYFFCMGALSVVFLVSESLAHKGELGYRGDATTRATVAVPPKEVPKNLYADYTLNGKIPVKYKYWNNAYSPSKPRVYTKKAVDERVAKALKNQTGYYKSTDTFLYAALKNFSVKDKAVAVLGSVTPWYESIVISRGGHPTTIEYNALISEDPRLKVMTVDEYDKNPCRFDALVSISSFEHDGLGRYGDPIDPFGDLKAMERCKSMLNPGGVLFLAVPNGPDCLLWNGCRIYGKIRMKMMQKGWRVLGYYGASKSFAHDISSIPLGKWTYQPVFVLTPEEGSEA